MDQIQRITRMERNLNEVSAAIRELSAAAQRYAQVQDQLRELSDYYGSPQWFRDYDDDRAGKLPMDLPRGVLSEDGVYNMLLDRNNTLETLHHILTLATQQTKEGSGGEL